mmetsp:Transcript_4952/g.6044  ORF Transcript_4952/g.6044 Transcript_4952/m.6044 type:complete len:95 (-) Transcript_4952:163-447(-)
MFPPTKPEPVEVHSDVRKEGENYVVSSTVCGETTCSMFDVHISDSDLAHYKCDTAEAFCEALFKYLIEKQEIPPPSIPSKITSEWLRSSHPSFE